MDLDPRKLVLTLWTSELAVKVWVVLAAHARADELLVGSPEGDVQ